MKLKTNKLLIVSIIIIGLTFFAATLWQFLGMSAEQTPILALLLMVAFGINIAGLILSISERKLDLKKSKIGLIGHSILILVFLVVVGYSLITMN